MSKVVVPYSIEGDSKKTQVEQMFDHIAPKYDLLNHLLSFGIDKIWRRKLVRQFGDIKPKLILDVATGTADVAIQLTELNPDKIIGIDISAEMLEIARKKVDEKKLSTLIALQQADSEHL